MTAGINDQDPARYSSFDEFFTATVRRTLAAVTRLANERAVAEDATQDAYLVMLAKWPERKHCNKQSNSRYVTGIAIRKTQDHYRKQQRLAPLADHHPGAGAPDDDVTIYIAVRNFLERQPMKRRIVGILYYLERYELAEVAEILDIAETTVRTHLDRLRPQLKSLAEPWRRKDDR